MPPVARVSMALRLVCFGLALTAAATARAEDGRVEFNRDVRPLLSDTCYACHGPDEEQRQAGLRLDVQDGALAELESGARAVVPGKSGESELIARITAADAALRMPPPESGKTLTPQQIDTLKRWVDQGAEWQGHWAFIPPERPELPAVKDAAWAVNPIDRFVLARLEREGLSPSPPADKITLLRRVTFDLTGLPPTVAEVEAFLADDSPNAYEQVVDRLLRSPRYGEHRAHYWLDLVRYGDTHGLHFDNERSLWLYREWVIDAFNANKPFDRFTVEQVAGDLLPDATLDQKIASGFNRCNVTTSEGGSINAEVLVRYAVDRTEALGTAFLGLTVGCAVCHDHKFDPLSQKEFYQIFAFYNAAADAAMDGNQLAPPPVLKVPTPEQTAELARLDAELAAVRQQIGEALAKVEYTDPQPDASSQPLAPREYVWIDDAAPAGANLQGNTPWEFVGPPDHPVHRGAKATRRQAQGLSQHFFTGASPGLMIGEGDTLFAYVYLDPANPPKAVMLQFNDGSWEHRAVWGEDVIPFGASGTPGRLPMGPLPKAGEWVRLEVAADKVGLKPGAVLNGWAFTQHDGTCYWDTAGIVTRTPQSGQSFDSQAAWEAYEKTLTQSKVPQTVRDAIKVEPAKRSDAQKKLIRDHFLEHVYTQTRPVFDPLHQQVDDLTKRRTDLDAAIPTTLVMADMPQPRETFVLVRGEYDQHGEKVGPGVPAFLPPLPDGAPLNRLGLAQWLVDPRHPLTARVAVNRFWQQFFGRGLVKTAEDFGAQGEWPTHPDLLDWLAVEFMGNAERGVRNAESESSIPHSALRTPQSWNVKRLLKLVVMSNTYRQSSRLTPPLLERDPENVLLARGPRFRMDAEIVRDTALAVSGLLAEQVGGRSVKPYQPPGVWEAVGFVGSNTREYKPDTGDALYRRSVYTFWKRTAPPASLQAFDAPSRETCVARRARTNTPLQALCLMNGDQFVEAARGMARRMIADGGPTPADRLTHGFRLATARRPQANELAVLLTIHAQQLAHYQSDKDAAAKLLTVGASPRDESLDVSEHAAMTVMANLILNLDETITKE